MLRGLEILLTFVRVGEGGVKTRGRRCGLGLTAQACRTWQISWRHMRRPAVVSELTRKLRRSAKQESYCWLVGNEGMRYPISPYIYPLIVPSFPTNQP